MRIGVNLLAFLPGVSGGIEFYIRNLLSALAEIDVDNDYFLFTNRDNHDTFQFDNPRFNRVRIDVGARPQIARVAWEQLVLPVMTIRYRLDVLHSPSYTFPVLAPVPGVLTICDMLYETYPQVIGEPKLTFWRVFVPWSARRCKQVLTISEYSRQDIVRLLGLDPRKVVTTPLALDQRVAATERPGADQVVQVLTQHRVRQPYVLNVGGVGDHKNPLALIRSLALLHKYPETGNLSVVITGNDYGARAKILAEASALDLQAYTCLPGYVAHADLPALYTGAAAYVFPSYFEGFGLTLLEAMAYGTPVVSSNRGSLPEVAGEGALVVDPDDLPALTSAIYGCITDSQLRARLIGAGYQRLNAFSWTQTAIQTLRAYQEAAGSMR